MYWRIFLISCIIFRDYETAWKFVCETTYCIHLRQCCSLPVESHRCRRRFRSPRCGVEATERWRLDRWRGRQCGDEDVNFASGDYQITSRLCQILKHRLLWLSVDPPIISSHKEDRLIRSWRLCCWWAKQYRDCQIFIVCMVSSIYLSIDWLFYWLTDWFVDVDSQYGMPAQNTNVTKLRRSSGVRRHPFGTIVRGGV